MHFTDKLKPRNTIVYNHGVIELAEYYESIKVLITFDFFITPKNHLYTPT